MNENVLEAVQLDGLFLLIKKPREGVARVRDFVWTVSRRYYRSIFPKIIFVSQCVGRDRHLFDRFRQFFLPFLILFG